MRFYAGSYSIPSEWTEAPYGHGEGIVTRRLNGDSVETLFPPVFELNPSFTVAEPEAFRLWAITEPETGGELICYDVASDGQLSTEPIARAVTGSDAPCHLALADDIVLVSHFHGGTVAVISRDEEGLPGPLLETLTPPDEADGRDLSSRRPRPHSAVMLPSGTEFVVADCGRDTVSLYSWDPELLQVQLEAVTALPEGSGPRHLAWSPRHDRLYASLQFAGGAAAVLSIEERSGSWALDVVQITEPSGLGRALSIPSEIALDPEEQFAVVANRGDNSLSVFAITESGMLAPFDCVDARGRTPRYFAFTPDGSALIVAHQESDELVVFDVVEGVLEHRVTVPCATPTSITFWPGDQHR